MRGEIIGFDPDSNTGAISSRDGRHYDLVRLEWRGPDAPQRGALVDFVAEGGHATQVYALPVRQIRPRATPPSSSIAST